MTPTHPESELVALLELSERATPGVWCAFLQGTTGPVVDDAIHAEPGQCCNGGGDIVCNEPGEEDCPASQKYWEANAKFIAALVNWFRSTRAAALPQGVSCEWVMDAHDGSWDTGCGNKHQFIEGDAADNQHLFCPYCGAHLVEPNYDGPPPAELGKGS